MGTEDAQPQEEVIVLAFRLAGPPAFLTTIEQNLWESILEASSSSVSSRNRSIILLGDRNCGKTNVLKALSNTTTGGLELWRHLQS